MIGGRVNFSKTWDKSGMVQIQVKSLNLTEANYELRQKSFFCGRWSWCQPCSNSGSKTGKTADQRGEPQRQF